MTLWKNKLRIFIFFMLLMTLSSCGFHLQGEMNLAPPLKRMYLQATDPYGHLARYLKDYLKMSKVDIVPEKNLASTILVIQNDSTSQTLLSVSGTQQTRQYRLAVNVSFYITDKSGAIILQPEEISEARTLTIQSNQVLGSSNEASLIYQQIRRSLANAIINRISSSEVTEIINTFFSEKTPKKIVVLKKHKKS